MQIGKPIQLILQNSLEPYKEKSGRQDDATKAWNFCTALYYKASHTPWRLIRDNNKITSCFVGISFYRSRDKKHVHTSLAHLFDDLGNGVILRGSPVEISEDDRQPHLKSDQAQALLEGVINEYASIHKTNPARVVIHKTSNFNDRELDGFSAAASSMRISYVDYVTILDSSTRLFRNGLYPIPRGSHLQIDDKTHLLFTKGSVEYYQTYPGMYVPRPLEIRIVESDESAKVICEEIMSLTKMNWNNTQIDGKYPITVDCARRVGLIMKYIPENVKPQTRYSFYM
jgi:argonaute-like protein implicated in RNA metabolism and viral defense